MPRALLSVSDKTGLAAFARGLRDRGFELVSTGGTARALAEAGLPVVNVSDVTGFPEMMDGRVKTLHPLIHGGILARRDRPDDLESARRHGIGLIDLVAVNLYPFEQTAARAEATFDDLIEQIDIGGPSLVRAAAKNFRDVLVVVDPGDYDEVLRALDAAGGVSLALRFDLARKAFAHTAAYDSAIASTLGTIETEGGTLRRAAPGSVALPQRLVLDLPKLRDLRYGENPHQKAAWYARGRYGFGAVDVLQGKELSFTNLLDLDSAARIVLEFPEPAAAVIKHTNPCGAATGATAAEAYIRAREADALAAFGGIVGLNRPIDAETAQAITSTFIEAVVAPAVHEDARPVLARKPNMRVVVVDFESLRHEFTPEVRSILGAVLVQQRDAVEEAQAAWPDGGGELRVVTRRQPTEAEWRALRFAWRVCAHVKSNSVIFTSDSQTLAIGAGQMSRVDAVKTAVNKAQTAAPDRNILAGSVVASDAFFPFRDGLDAVVAAGATAVVQPGGSVRDAEVIAAADEHGIAMVFTGRRHFRH
ncbi:MAG TPA: bifunctional phosphoribosylaminoimidazolecarboxamide formyltransferase/IMP cyclohydrolase [Vicinamibacterales bacterium]